MGILDFLSAKKGFKIFNNKEDGYSFQIPDNWKLVSVSESYGHVFSDEKKEQGVLTISESSSLFADLGKFLDGLILGLKKEQGYNLKSRAKIEMKNGMEAEEAVFEAKATANGKQEDAIVTTVALHDKKLERFILITFSVLKKDNTRYSGIYETAKTTFRLLS